MIKTPQLLKDKRYGLFYAFTAVIIALLLTAEEFIDGDFESYSEVLVEFLAGVPVFFITTLIIGFFSVAIIRLLDKKYPWEERSFERLIYEISIALFLVTILTVMTSLSESLFPPEEDLEDDESKFQVLTMLMFFIDVSLVFAFHEYISLNEDKNEIAHAAKELERQNYISKYEALRNQVNPHFLFNSLNVLSSLIYTDIDLSDKFIRKFSEVFRYALELNKEELVPLRREVDFIDSYFFLQKIRHDDCVKVSTDIKPEYLDDLIPPMALQIVVENAFKHNIISRANPLHIELYTDRDKLKVKNNYQSRADSSFSTGIGQKNLLERYEILSVTLPEFYIEDNYYIAELPILKDHNQKWK
ncbi:MAG: histidine kinase [Cyclobacteriaceae bacterium]